MINGINVMIMVQNRVKHSARIVSQPGVDIIPNKGFPAGVASFVFPLCQDCTNSFCDTSSLPSDRQMSSTSDIHVG